MFVSYKEKKKEDIKREKGKERKEFKGFQSLWFKIDKKKEMDNL